MKYDFDTITDRRGTNSEKWNVKPGELPMWIADMDFKTAPEITASIQKRAAHGIFGYSGIPDEWYAAVQNWWKNRYKFEFEQNQVIFSCGVVPSISTAVRKFTEPGQKIAIMTPVYNIFFNSILNNARIPVESPLTYKNGEYSVDFAALEKILSDPSVTMLIFCNPHNPCGKIWSKEELQKIGELCAKHSVLVLSDEIHCDLTEPGKTYTPFAAASELNKQISLTCVAPSKTFNIAGLHASAVIAQDPALYKKMNRALNTDEVAEPNSFAIEASLAAWKHGEPYLEELRQYVFENRRIAEQFIEQNIPQIKAIKAQATYLLWIDCNSVPLSSAELAEQIRAKTGLILSAGGIYGKAGEHFLRMNLACPKTVLQDGLNRLKAYFSSSE